MATYLCLTARFLQPYYHGRSDGGEPEWPPSPLRLFQSLVAAAAAKWKGDKENGNATDVSLRWLECQPPPLIVAPVSSPAVTKYRLYVPDNTGDLAAGTWSRGDTNRLLKRTEKDVRPMRLLGEAVHFLFKLNDGECSHFDIVRQVSRSITHLGWGIDAVVGDASLLSGDDLSKLKGERWQSCEDPHAKGLRVPQVGTLNALNTKHEAFLIRVDADGFNPVPPLSTFRVVGYRRTTELGQPQLVVFSILKPDASGMKTFDPLRRSRDVAGMTRHAVAEAARGQGWTEEQINVFVHGKTADGSRPPNGDLCPDRFQYLPLPTINHKLNRVESIRRVMITAPAHCGREAAWVRRAVAGAELVNHHGAVALLTILPSTDWVFRQYVEESTTWSTVTPVILPGYDDPNQLRRKLNVVQDAVARKRYVAKLDERIDELLRKALRQAGYSSELIAQVELDWSNVGFRPGVELASRYLPPENLDKYPRLHVKVRFPVAVRGPLAVGSGRFRGFGLFAVMDS
jgi:CRISPR-associated protein Csb2